MKSILGTRPGWVASVTAIIFAASVFGPGMTGVASAQEVVIFNKAPPSSDELANIMFPVSKPDKPRVRTRGISPRPRRTSVAKKIARQVGLMINFEFNSTDIVPESRPYLDRVAGMMSMDRIASKGIIIEGHTDATGSEAYNQRLSVRRAEAIKRYLVEQHGVASHRLVTMGKGERSPLVREDPNHPANRRVQFRAAY